MPGFLGMPGVTRLTTTDAIVGASGKPIRVYDVTMVSGGTASKVILRNGTTTGGTPQLQIDGVINQQVSWSSTNGLLFPDGCFADVDANTVALTVSWCVEE